MLLKGCKSDRVEPWKETSLVQDPEKKSQVYS